MSTTQLEALDEERRRSVLPRDRSAAAWDHSSDVGDLWRILLRQYFMIGTVTLTLAALAILYCFFTSPLYTATSQVLVDPRQHQIVANDPNASALAPDGGIAQVESQTQVIESSSVLLRVIAALDLVHDPEFGPNPNGLTARLRAVLGRFGLGGAAPSEAAAAEETLNALKKRLAIRRADKVFVIDIVATAQTGDKAARIANAVADAYLADQTQARADAARRDSEALTARLAELRRRVNEAEEKVETYKADKDIIDSSGRLVDEQQLTDVNAQLALAQTRVSELKARVDQIEQARRAGLDSDSTAEAIQSAVVTRLRQQYAELVARAADLRTQMGDRHPALIAVEAQLRNVAQLIRAELDRIARAARADYDRARDNLRLLQADVGKLKQTTVTTDQASIKLHELEREAEASRAVYAAFLGRAQEIREQAAVDTTNARIITRAAAPLDKSWPPTLYFLVGALVTGLAIGSGVALTREYLVPTVLRREQVQHLTGEAPCLGQLAIAAPVGWLARKPPSAPTRDTAALQVVGRLYDLGSPRGELRAVLVLSPPTEEKQAAKAVTALAHAAAAEGLQVLILEMTKDTDAPAPPRAADGMLTVGGVMLADAHSDVFRLGLTPDRLEASGRESTATLKRLLRDALGSFDLVFVHGGASASNVRFGVLASLFDAVLLVVRLGQTRQSDVVEAVEGAALAGIPVSASLLLDG